MAISDTQGRAEAGRALRPPARPDLPVHHRDVGALLLLRDALAAHPLHGEVRAAARQRRQRDRARDAAQLLRIDLRAARHAAVRLAHLRPLHRARLCYAAPRRHAGRPRARPAPHRRARRLADGDRPFHDGVRAAVPVGAAGADLRQRRVQAQHLGADRRALRTRRSAPRPRLFDLLCRHQSRRAPRAAGVRHARRRGRLALRLRRRRRRHGRSGSSSISTPRRRCRPTNATGW